MAFGPIGRDWQPRPRYAGTYDQKWLDEVSPFLPGDFDELYYQAAPLDQQVDYLRGGEDMVLTNLMPGCPRNFSLPTLDTPVEITRRGGMRQEMKAVLDTVVLEPELGRFLVSWRTSRLCAETSLKSPESWPEECRLDGTGHSHRADYYPSLREMVTARERVR